MPNELKNKQTLTSELSLTNCTSLFQEEKMTEENQKNRSLSPHCQPLFALHSICFAPIPHLPWPTSFFIHQQCLHVTNGQGCWLSASWRVQAGRLNTLSLQWLFSSLWRTFEVCHIGIIVRAARKEEPVDLLQVLRGKKLILSQMVQFDVLPGHWLVNKTVSIFLWAFNIDGRLLQEVRSSVFI